LAGRRRSATRRHRPYVCSRYLATSALRRWGERRAGATLAFEAMAGKDADRIGWGFGARRSAAALRDSGHSRSFTAKPSR
jgi:hypothetical protein